LALSVRRRSDDAPFYVVAATSAAAFGTFLITLWPYMIPFSITIAEAAAPRASLTFMFWGAGLFVLPLMLLYAAISTCFAAESTRSHGISHRVFGCRRNNGWRVSTLASSRAWSEPP
jgi:hypothetical protein